MGNAENESFGIELGYAYVDSPVICSEPGVEIPDDPLRYLPTTAPGVRMPSVLMENGTPIFDRLGPWFTLAASANDRVRHSWPLRQSAACP